MKKAITILVLFLSISVFAQTPEKLSYQTVLRNTGNIAVVSSMVSMQISIIQGSVTGTVVYSETQTPNTNADGLVSIEIGGGTGFDTINWANGPYFIHTETDPTGGTNYILSGTSQLLSVPYALYAKTAETARSIIVLEDRLFDLELAEGIATLLDIEDNEYPVVKIGEQVWMAENLRTANYNDGTPITEISDPIIWGESFTGAFCWYDNDSSNYENLYGKMYNWYSINTGNLCPIGWHVPVYAEWVTLIDFLANNGFGYQGSGYDIAKSMADSSGWASSAIAGTIGNDMGSNNSSGFNALPGGYRYSNGSFGDAGSIGYWWSATGFDVFDARYIYLSYNSTIVESYNYDKNVGLSVRCIKN